jgi:hypothetical protein
VRRKVLYFQRPASPRFRTFDRIAGVGMGPRFRGDDKRFKFSPVILATWRRE